MALNPIVYTEKVVRSFLRYQLTTYALADQRLHQQMRSLLSLDETRNSPLLKGPYISLSRPFRQGASVTGLIQEGVFHSHMRERIPAAISHVYGHQEQALRSIHSRRTTLVATGTGSGKSECFLYPIISKCLELRDQGAAAGISAVIVYPMNALAEDQLQRLRSLLAGTGIPFGMYVGKTPETESEVSGIRLSVGASKADYDAAVTRVREEGRSDTVHPAEEVCSRERMRTAGKQPRIILTNVKQLELLLTRQKDTELFANARLDFLVFDEAHTFTGAQGAETACLIRRLRNYCGRGAEDTVCVATSATIADTRHPDAAREFASRFFGVPKDSVTTVGEAYEAQVWAARRNVAPAPSLAPAELLARCVQAVESAPEESKPVREAYAQLTTTTLSKKAWPEALHEGLSESEILYQLSELLLRPQRLDALAKDLGDRIRRPIDEAEILSWLTLGAAARKDGRPLVRPVVHGFIRGISGAVVSFPESTVGPKLWLSAEDEIAAAADQQQHAHFPVLTCTTCGQHYFTTVLADFDYTGVHPGGGQASGETSYWQPLEQAHGGVRVVLTDTIVGDSDDHEIESSGRTSALHFCRRCGTAHRGAGERCLHCGILGARVELHAIRQNKENPGYLSSCLCCGATAHLTSGRYREPARPVRATNVADVHVLAQDMVQHAERPRLLVFCDNRQDAAFQSGWMKDHARRFRLRALMAEGLQSGACSIGDLALHVGAKLEQDEAMSRALIPEVWRVARREGGGGRHDEERRKYLRIQVLREVTHSARQSIGLEPWGRIKVEYQGLDTSWPWIQQRARLLGMPPEDLREGVAAVLDYMRRQRVLFDPELMVFTKFWNDGDLEVEQGYLTNFGSPKGAKLRREDSDKPSYVFQWLASRGESPMRQLVVKWGVEKDNAEEFLTGLFNELASRKILRPVQLKGARGNPLPQVSGVYQIDADCLRLLTNHGYWRCNRCRRRTPRRTPRQACPGWRCDGQLHFVREEPDNYDLSVLDGKYEMLRPEEHTAMVPHEERERLENLFKGDSDAVNAFVCTPTLELGVDIGQLDSVLMRNVPPLPANYWQRAGRAGRRHRMAVNLTYCRTVSHDRAYFADPVKLLAGRVDPPAFNLRNELMVAKHVHASVLTRLHQYARSLHRSEADRARVAEILKTCIPQRISSYLFEDSGVVRHASFDFSLLQQLIDGNIDDLSNYVTSTFQQGWPADAASVVEPKPLRALVEAFVDSLRKVVARLEARRNWALTQIRRLNLLLEEKASLEPAEKALFRSCNSVLTRLKSEAPRRRGEAEGFDDSNTYGVLAAEGFLPGYGLDNGSIRGTAEIPHWNTGARDFTLPRPPSVALREYVPGNLIYANGHRFVARRFHRDMEEDRAEVPGFEISTERQAIRVTTESAGLTGISGAFLKAISVCDVDLIHQSHISDEEELRFQLGVAVYGIERQQHSGGKAYAWGVQDLHHRRGVRLRLVNVGASHAIADTRRPDRFGYPICMVCGFSVSPLSSDEQRRKFEEQHKERCRSTAKPIGLYADVVADALSLPGCANQTTAYSVLEALRFAATQVLDMHMEDLQVLVIGHVDRDDVDALLWDPMPGGSGLLDQVCARFTEIVETAINVVDLCPSACKSSCIDCLQTFRNGFYHKNLDRKAALERLRAWGSKISPSHDIPALQPNVAAKGAAQPVNEAERKLQHLLKSAGFNEGIRGEQIRLSIALGTTTPDVIYRAAHHPTDEGVAIYLDGMSRTLHGNPATREKDITIRSWLRNNGWIVIEITAAELDDRNAMVKHFRVLASNLEEDEIRKRVTRDTTWYSLPTSSDALATFSPKIVQPLQETVFKTCLPLVPLRAAAGGFGEPEFLEGGDWPWVEVPERRSADKGTFVAQVVGHSMEPRIPSGSYCIFRHPVTGSRQGRILLVGLREGQDSETGEKFTVKRYESRKAASSDGMWRHVEIILKPENAAFSPIVLREDSEDQLRVVAEFVEVLGV